MKKFVTLFFSFLTLGIYAQTAFVAGPIPQQKTCRAVASNLPFAGNGSGHVVNNGLRSESNCDSSDLNYSVYANQAAQDATLQFVGLAVSGGTIEVGEITSFIDTFHDYENSQVWQIYDSLAYVDAQSNLYYQPIGNTTITIDSLNLWMALVGDTGLMDNDSLVFIIAKVSGNTYTPFDTVVFDNSADFLDSLVVGANQVINISLPMGNVQLPTGDGFRVQVNYYMKDTSTHFYLGYTYVDSCGTDYAAYIPTFPFWAGGYQIQPTGVGPAAMAAYFDNTYGYQPLVAGTPETCLFVYEQNWYINPVLTICTPYSAIITPAKASGCPGGSAISLSASAFGTSSSTINYYWSANNGGILGGSEGQSNTVSLPSGTANVTVTVVAVDGNNDSTTTQAVITNDGINVVIDGTTTLVCGGASSTLTAHATGTDQNGKTYQWSPGDSTTSSILVAFPGQYGVTVTNAAGCKASDDTTVAYQGGVTNNVNFTSPYPICVGTKDTWTNTSSGINGWTPEWIMGDVPGQFFQNVNETYAYSTAGLYTVTLVMDSAGCLFQHSESANVFAANNPNCATGLGIQNVGFDNEVSLWPNPSNGNINISVSDVQKNISIKVYNILGSEVTDFEAMDVAAPFNKVIDLGGLASGTYLVKIQSGDNIALKKLVIAR